MSSVTPRLPSRPTCTDTFACGSENDFAGAIPGSASAARVAATRTTVRRDTPLVALEARSHLNPRVREEGPPYSKHEWGLLQRPFPVRRCNEPHYVAGGAGASPAAGGAATAAGAV